MILRSRIEWLRKIMGGPGVFRSGFSCRSPIRNAIPLPCGDPGAAANERAGSRATPHRDNNKITVQIIKKSII